MARALNNVMRRRGPVFGDRYHAHLLRSPREAANAVRYARDNWRVHGLRPHNAAANDVDPYCSAFPGRGPPLVAQPQWWMLRVGMTFVDDRPRLAG